MELCTITEFETYEITLGQRDFPGPLFAEGHVPLGRLRFRGL